MKITIVTDQSGHIIGTARHHAEEGKPVARLVAGPGQQAHDIELPSSLENETSAEALHLALERHLASNK